MSVFVIEDSDSEDGADTTTPTATPTHSNSTQEEEKSGLIHRAANRSVGTFAFVGALLIGCCCCCTKEYQAAAVESYDRHTVFGWFCPIEHVARPAK